MFKNIRVGTVVYDYYLDPGGDVSNDVAAQCLLFCESVDETGMVDLIRPREPGLIRCVREEWLGDQPGLYPVCDESNPPADDELIARIVGAREHYKMLLQRAEEEGSKVESKYLRDKGLYPLSENSSTDNTPDTVSLQTVDTAPSATDPVVSPFVQSVPVSDQQHNTINGMLNPLNLSDGQAVSVRDRAGEVVSYDWEAETYTVRFTDDGSCSAVELNAIKATAPLHPVEQPVAI